MIKTLALISLAAIVAAVTAAVGGQLSVRAAAEQSGIERSFITPRLDGRRLDVRYSTTTPASPAMTAERYCRSQGYDHVVGYSVQPASATRMIGDFEAQNGPATELRAFYAIRCANDRAETQVADRSD
jgi:hypothetical protein